MLPLLPRLLTTHGIQYSGKLCDSYLPLFPSMRILASLTILISNYYLFAKIHKCNGQGE
jgi:hypothetical protein